VASRLQALRGWFDARMPTIGAEWRKHAAAYYVPKNLNLWYEFGALAGLVLIIQIVSGIFLYPLSLSRPGLSLYHLGSEAGGPDCR
jgi:quinol-cytochrome oxidoreductase complex cytochrome b subunit